MPCPICGREKYCLVADDGESVICTKVSNGAVRQLKGYSGWLHNKDRGFISKSNVVKSPDYKPDNKYVQSFYAQLETGKSILSPLAIGLNVPVRSLVQLGTRYANEIWNFPMYDSNRQIIGVKRRNLEGKKWCLRSSQLGVYIPSTFDPEKSVVVCEGESDTAAALSVGLNAIGRASATSCGAIIKELVSNAPEVVFVADNDSHLPPSDPNYMIGLKKSVEIAKKIKSATMIVYNENYKDLRDWVTSGYFSMEVFVRMRKEPSCYESQQCKNQEMSTSKML